MPGFAANFTLREFEAASKGPLSASMRSSAASLSHYLQAARNAFGGPIVVTSFYRPESTTQHGEGTAVDWRLPPNVTSYRMAQRLPDVLKAAGLPWGQMIFYPWAEDHVHLSLPTGRARGAVLVQLRDESYVALSSVLLAQFPGAPAGVVAPVDVVGVYTPAQGPDDEGDDAALWPWVVALLVLLVVVLVALLRS